jgi:acetyltransferase
MRELFAPKSVAVIGVSHDPAKIGYIVFDNLISGYKGQVYGVNPDPSPVLGQELYKTVLDIKKPVEMAVICVPDKLVAQVLESCGKKKVKVAIIITAGFSEAGVSGKEREVEVRKVAERFGIRLLGPNCLGLINNFNNLNASFATAQMPPKYKVGIFSQSGAMGAAMLDFANGGGFGFSYFVSLGNKTDISEIDLIEAWASDENVNVGVGYLEDVKEGEKFLAAARKFTSRKPLIILKGGTTKEGSGAAHLHTAAMACDSVVFEAALTDAGVVLAKNLADLFELAISFSENGLPKGKRLAIVSNAGGPSVLAADACGIEQVDLAKLSASSYNELASKTNAASIENPIDLRGDATAADFKEAFVVCERDKNVDGILAIVTPQAMTELEGIAWEAVAAKKWGKKPIYVNFIGGELTRKAEEVCRANGIATFSYPERAVRAFRYQANFEAQKNHQSRAMSKNPRHKAAKSIINFAGNNFSSDRLGSLFGIYDIPMAKTKLLKSEHGVAEALKEIKPPVVMKIASPDILHKTDVGGVMLGIESEEEGRAAFNKIIANVQKECPKARIEGVTVMQTAKEGLEVILGAKRDPIFGPVLMFGFGGIYVELISDFVTVVGPFDKEKLKKAVEKTAVSKILQGYRGKETISSAKLIQAMMGIASLITEHPEIAQVEINPLVIEGKGEVLGLDAKISLAEKTRK